MSEAKDGVSFKMRLGTYVYDLEKAYRKFAAQCRKRKDKLVVCVVKRPGECECLRSTLDKAGVITEEWCLYPTRQGCGRLEILKRAAFNAFEARLTDGKEWLPDAFCFSDDYLATGAMAALCAHGVRFPQDVRIATVTNIGNAPVFIGGVGVGVSSIAAPVYISEISPAASRGRLCALFQFNIVLGMVVSQVVNWMIGSAALGETTWRWMLGAEAVPALVFTLLCPFLVESPRWLAMRSEGAARGERSSGGFFSKANLRPISLAFCVAMFNQLSGICAVLYFARRVFQLAGCSADTALVVTAWLTVLLGVGTFVGLFLIDRIGRRQMLIWGGVCYLVSLFPCAVAFAFGWNVLAAACIFLFIFAHAVGQGTVIWVFISEVFAQKFRARGQSFGSFTHWMFCATLTFVFPLMTAKMPTWSIFALFGTFMVFHLLWAVFVVPETKGRTLEEISSQDV